MNEWVKELPAEVMVCDTVGSIKEMNTEAETLFANEGGYDLLGTNVLDCHPEPARSTLTEMMNKQLSNAYYNTEDGVKRFFFQCPWYQAGQFTGFVEISFPVPDEMQHFNRG